MRASDSLPRSVLTRIAVVYIRQSTPAQVRDNLESQRRQYDLDEVARRHGFARVDVIDEDLGLSASGAVARPGFERLVARLCTGEIGAVLCFQASRPAPCTSRSRERGLPLAGARECPRCRSWFHPHCHYPRYATISCAVSMDYASSCPCKAAGGTQSPGSPCDMTESRRRHDPSGANQRLRGRQQRHGLAAKRLMVFTSWGCPQHIRTWPTPTPKLPSVGDARPQVFRVSFRPESESPGALSSRAASRPRGECSR